MWSASIERAARMASASRVCSSTTWSCPPKVGHSNAKHYKSRTVTEIVEFDGPHLLPAIDRWEEVADFVLDWALKHAG